MPGFNVQAQSAAPFQMLPPEVLAQLAAQGFRPPAQMQAPAMMGPQGGGEGFGLGDGLAMAGMGLGMIGKGGVPMGSSATTDAPGFGAGLGSSGQGILAGAHKQWLAQNPDAQGYGNTLTQPDFLTGAWRKITGLF
jgi:hypothetical protein